MIFRNLHAKAHDPSVPHQQHPILPITHRSSKWLRPMGNDAHFCRRSKFPGFSWIEQENSRRS